MAEESATARVERVVEAFDPEGRCRGSAPTRGIDEERGAGLLLRSEPIPDRRGEAHLPATLPLLDRHDLTPFPHDRAGAGGAFAQERIDIGPQPVRVAPGIGSAGGDKERGGVVGGVAKRLPRPMVEIGKPTFFSTSQVGIARLPRSPPGQGGELRQAVPGC